MKKILVLVSILVNSVLAMAQPVSTGNSALNNRTEWFRPNSPTNMDGNRVIHGWIKDSIEFVMKHNLVRFTTLAGSGNRMQYVDNTGRLQASSFEIVGSDLTNWNNAYSWGNHASVGYLLAATAATTYQPLIGYTPYNNTNPSGYISSYTETDPIWLGVAASYKTKIQNDTLYQSIGTYLTTEVDPNVPSYSKSLTGFSIIKSSTDPLYYPISSNPSGFITTISGLTNNNLNGSAGITDANIVSSSVWNAKQSSLTVGVDYLAPTGSAASLTSFPTFNQNTTGSAAKLTTSRNINGVSFDGSTNITVADATKEPTITATTSADYYRGDKTFQILDKTTVGLSNVDNTSDANKPVGTATQTALNLKVNTSSLATVATTGAYTDLTGKPTIPSAQVNSDWNSVSGINQITNKPNLATVATSGVYSDLTGKPTFKRVETYSGTTNGSGVYTVTFGTPFSVAPNIQASITNQSTTNQYVRISSISTTGFTINAYSFNSNNLLGIISLLTTTSNVSGLTTDVVVTEK